MVISPAASRFGTFELHPTAASNAPYVAGDNNSKTTVTSKLHRLGDVGAILLLGTSSLTLFSPVIPKLLKQRLSQATLEKMQDSRVLSQLLDKEKALKLGFRLAGVPGLLMYLYNMEIALNTQQPTKFMTTLVSIGHAFLSFFIPTSLFQRGFITLSAGIWSAGERNDIENTLHPNKRRELDIKQYLSQLNPRQMRNPFQKQITFPEVRHYIFQDFKYIASIKPWQELFTKKRSELLSTAPASYQSALSSQFFFLTSLLIWTAWVLKKSSASTERIVAALQKAGQASALFGTGLAVLPLWMRAWQMRDQADSRLMLLGGPIMTLGKSLSFADKYLFLSGLNGLGGSFWSRGLAGNSQKYAAMRSYMKNLYIESIQHPELSAGDILGYLRIPNNQVQLQQHIGQSRANFVTQTLKQAQQAQQQYGTPLSTFLAPIIHSHNQETAITHSNLMGDE